VQAAGGRALILEADVADPAAVERAAEEVEAAFGPIDVWVNSAMATVMGEALQIDVAEFRRVTEVTYLGTVWGTMSALRRMVPRDRGIVVQVGSAVAYRAIPLQSPYSGAKFAVRGFTDAVRTELLHRKSGVRMTMVQLPAVDTPQFDWLRSHLRFRAQPLAPIFEPEVAAEAVLRAVDHPRRELFVGGRATLGVVLQALAPAFMDRFMARTAVTGAQAAEPEDPTRPSNLWRPLDASEDHGARGRFDHVAHERSVQLWANTHRGAIATVGGAVLLVGLGGRLLRGR
jgi:short-subunit dehydrogenase